MVTTSALGRLTNFRDLGGYTTRSGRVVRPGLVFRCGSMHLWTPEETSVVRRDLAPRTLIDLRHHVEAEMFPVPREDIGARYVNVAFTRRTSDDGPPPPALPSLVETYIAITERCGDSIAQLLETLTAVDAFPAIVFCAAGKDRTGVATALILGALNVPDEQIIEDYARSGVIDPRSLGDLYAEHMADLPADHQGSEPSTMRAFLSHIRRDYGSIRGFVARCGFGPDRLVALERALLTSEVVDQPTRPVT